MGDPNRRLDDLGIVLPDPFPSFGTYEMAVLDGDTLYTAGHIPVDGTNFVTGKLGADLTLEQGVAAAQLAALSMLSTIRAELGDLARVRRVLNVTVTVNSTPDFTDHTAVGNGASDLLVDVLGDAGKHARLAVGVSSLPGNLALEVQAIVAVHP